MAVDGDVQQPDACILRALAKLVRIPPGQTTGGGTVRILVDEEGAVEFQQANVECFNGKRRKVKESQGVIPES